MSCSWRFITRYSIDKLNLLNLLNLGYHKHIWSYKAFVYLLIFQFTLEIVTLGDWHDIAKGSLGQQVQPKPIQTIWKSTKEGPWLLAL